MKIFSFYNYFFYKFYKFAILTESLWTKNWRVPLLVANASYSVIFMMMVFDFYVGCEIRGLKLNMEYLIPSSGIVFFFVNYFILIQTDTYYSDERTFDQLARKEKTIGSVIFCVSVIAVIFSFFYLARQGRTQTVINFYERSFQIRKGMTVAEVEETMNKKIIERDRNHLVTTYSLEAELIELCRIEIVIDNNSQTVKRVEYKKCR